MLENVPLVHIAPASFIDERDLPLQMEAHLQCGRLLCLWFLSKKETVSKMCLFKIGHYYLALLTSPQEEAYEQLFEGLLAY